MLASVSAALAPPGHHQTASSTNSFAAIWRPACSTRLYGTDVKIDAEDPSTSYPLATGPANWKLHRRRRPARRCAALSDTTPGQREHQPGGGGDGKVGVVIVDHGSRKKASNDMLVEFGDLYGSVTGQEIVEIAHMEIARPTIEEAIGRCAARGASTVVIAPYFLSKGRHIQEDIPALVADAQGKHPGLRCIIAEPIGIDVLMVQLISNRVAAALRDGDVAAEAELRSVPSVAAAAVEVAAP